MLKIKTKIFVVFLSNGKKNKTNRQRHLYTIFSEQAIFIKIILSGTATETGMKINDNNREFLLDIFLLIYCFTIKENKTLGRNELIATFHGRLGISTVWK